MVGLTWAPDSTVSTETIMQFVTMDGAAFRVCKSGGTQGVGGGRGIVVDSGWEGIEHALAHYDLETFTLYQTDSSADTTTAISVEMMATGEEESGKRMFPRFHGLATSRNGLINFCSFRLSCKEEVSVYRVLNEEQSYLLIWPSFLDSSFSPDILSDGGLLKQWKGLFIGALETSTHPIRLILMDLLQVMKQWAMTKEQLYEIFKDIYMTIRANSLYESLALGIDDFYD